MQYARQLGIILVALVGCAERDLSTTRDLSSAHDLSTTRDISSTYDLSSAHDSSTAGDLATNADLAACKMQGDHCFVEGLHGDCCPIGDLQCTGGFCRSTLF
jgi:hypothetical protein